ncbi:DUF2971 domain-containing protein [Priestia megaterium]|uniref:DUF2971 domain-containing protein n=1 Tax=Priestia megaterium TaxID=1404 RepID=A0A6H1P2Z4_PRIMG|nr:DUF2971 domain-containing protein [Priestia megaterium]QIZ07651.1 DUF2971 domain-containing protein [Priestia megaterium]
MDLTLKGKAVGHAMQFESIYDYSEQYKVIGNPTVWKYMGLKKFESLLKNKAMFFAKPSAFEDNLEGSYSFWDIEEYEAEGELPFITSREYMKKVQEFSAISCWHINNFESAAMWDLYLGGKDGIAIKTNYANLYNSITDLKYRVFSGRLQYIDFNKEMTSRNIYDTLFYKRKSFSHENELRLMIIASRIDERYLERFFERQGIHIDLWEERMEELEKKSYEFAHEKGTFVSCELDKLIDKIYVSPRSSQEVVDEVTEMVTKYGLSRDKVIQSDLYEDFIY